MPDLPRSLETMVILGAEHDTIKDFTELEARV